MSLECCRAGSLSLHFISGPNAPRPAPCPLPHLQGVQLARSLAAQADPLKQAAEVALYFERFEAAEEAYRKMDRLDLAVALRSRLGGPGHDALGAPSPRSSLDRAVDCWNRTWGGRLVRNVAISEWPTSAG